MPQLSAGCKDILLSKLLYAILCSVLSQILFLTTYLFITNINIFQPFAWVNSTLGALTSVSTWLYLIPLCLIIFAQGVICSKDYVFEVSYRTSRVMKFLGVFSLRNLAIFGLYMVTGVLIVWLYLNILGGRYENMYAVCGAKYCLVEETFFMELNGLWIGVWYFGAQCMSEEKSIAFPVIQQGKLLAVKAKIGGRLHLAMRQAIWPTFYFIALYYYKGVAFRDWFMQVFGLKLEKEGLNVLGFLNTPILVYSWLFSTLFIFSMLSMRLFFEVFLTEHWAFPVESEFERVLTLQQALGRSKVPIIRHLACLYLYALSLWDQGRRAQLFVLSQPGGHPHTWNGVLQEVLLLVDEFSAEINKATDAILAPEPQKPREELREMQQPGGHAISSPGLRNMSLPRPEPLNIVNVTQNETLTGVADQIKALFVGKLTQVLAAVKKKSGIQYFFGEVPESRICYLLSKGQPVIWAVQGLSFITSASFTEDRYGIVQKDLPVILTSLMTLKQNLDKMNKVSVLGRKGAQGEVFKTQLKMALRTAVKRSLYNICNTFGEYLNHVPLSKEIHQHLQSFVSYREG